MVKAGGKSGLALEAAPEMEVVGHLGGDQLERDITAACLRARPVHGAHPTARQQPFDPIAGKAHARLQLGRHELLIPGRTTGVDRTRPSLAREHVAG